MRIFEALLSELQRLESVSDEQWNQEMQTNEDFGILVFAALGELETIAWVNVQVPITGEATGDKERVKAIIEKVLGQ